MKIKLNDPDLVRWLLIAADVALMAASHKGKGGGQVQIPDDVNDTVKKVLESVNTFLHAQESERKDDIKFDGILTNNLTPSQLGIIEDFIDFLAEPTRKLDQRFRFNCMLLLELTDEATLIKRLRELSTMATDDQRLKSCQRRGILQGDADPLAALKKGVPQVFKQSLAAIEAAYPAWEAQLESDIHASGIPNAITDANTKLDDWATRLKAGIRSNLKK